MSPLEDREMPFRWPVANAVIGNDDTHARNVSVVYVSADRVRLAKAYDVVVTAVYYLDRSGIHNIGTHPRAGIS